MYKDDKVFAGVALVIFLLWLCFVCAIIFVAGHFITKWW